MVDLTPEQQAARDAMIARRQPSLTAEQRDARDAMMARRPEPVGWAEASARLPVSSVTRGVTELLGAPRAIADLYATGGDYLMKKAGIPEDVRKNTIENVTALNPTSYFPKAETMRKAVSDLTGGFTDYEATSPEGKVLEKTIEFAPAAGLAVFSGGASALPQALTYGAVVPAVMGTAAKYAGDAIGGEKTGDYAQLAAEILSPFGAAKIGPALSRIPKSPQIADVANDINRLEKFGISVTPGSIRTNPADEGRIANLLEVQNPRIAEKIRGQSKQFTDGVLKDAGIDDNLARVYGKEGGLTPANSQDVVTAHAKKVGEDIGDFYENLSHSDQPQLPSQSQPTTLGNPPDQYMQERIDYLDQAIDRVNEKLLKIGKPNVFDKIIKSDRLKSIIDLKQYRRELIDEINQLDSPYGVSPPALPPAIPPSNALNVTEIDAMASKMPNMAKIDPTLPVGDQIHDLRQAANRVVAGVDPALNSSHKTQAQALINYIDSKVADAVGPEEFKRLQDLNEKYSKLSLIQDALERSAVQGHPGIITPQNIISSGGNRHTKEINEIAQLADRYLLQRGMAQTPENKRSIMAEIIATIAATGAAGVNSLQYGMDLMGALKIAGAGVGGGLVGNVGSRTLQAATKAARGSDVAQSIARSRALYKTANPFMSSLAPSVSNLSDDRMGRKSGGRVDSHDVEADHLVRAAERAKKGLSAHTEGLLNTSDDAVASALEVANRSI
jgi:hypothetical protein